MGQMPTSESQGGKSRKRCHSDQACDVMNKVSTSGMQNVGRQYVTKPPLVEQHYHTFQQTEL